MVLREHRMGRVTAMWIIPLDYGGVSPFCNVSREGGVKMPFSVVLGIHNLRLDISRAM
jgi:hypothetical protein